MVGQTHSHNSPVRCYSKTYSPRSLAFAFIVLAISGCRDNSNVIRAEGEAIVSAISTYRSVNKGQLPSTLGALVPQYLKAAPSFRWQYSHFRSATGEEGYFLTSAEGGRKVHHFDSVTAKWASSQPADY